MKKCAKCDVRKDKKEFAMDSARDDGLYQWCKACTREHYGRYYRGHRSERIAAHKRYSSIHRREENARGREWYRANKSRALATSALWQRRNPLATLWNSYRSRARRQGIDFTIARASFETMVMSPCSYCGLPALPSNGIDRVDNGLGYTPENSMPSCAQCNIAKGALSLEAFGMWLTRISADFGVKCAYRAAS